MHLFAAYYSQVTSPSPDALAQHLKRDGYVSIRGLVGEPGLEFLRGHVRGLGPHMVRDRQVPGAPIAYGDPVLDSLLEVLRPRVAELAAAEVYPTYSFVRVYGRGDTLSRHTDRPACEIGLSLCLDFTDPEPWPLWIEGRRGKSRVVLAPGDAVVYHGIECPHWRDPCHGDEAAQVFLHYVRTEGPYANWRFDGREALSTAPREIFDLLARSIGDPPGERP